MNENLKNFIMKLGEDSELQEKMKQCKSPEEAYKLATSVSDGYSQEEFVEVMKILSKGQTDELSEEDLEQVAGGLSTRDWFAIAATGAGLAGGAAAAV